MHPSKLKYSLEQMVRDLMFYLSKRKFYPEHHTKINVTDLQVMGDHTIFLTYQTTCTHSDDILQEIFLLCNFLHAFFKNEYKQPSIKHYATQAMLGERKLMYVITPSSAKSSFEMLKLSEIQPYTQDFFHKQAKQRIMEIENSLRKIICHEFRTAKGKDWWDHFFIKENGKEHDAKKRCMKDMEEDITDGEIIILYTYVTDLSDVITNHWDIFGKYFHGKGKTQDESKQWFNDQMNSFNLLRRIEAHQRDFTEQHIRELDRLQAVLLPNILDVFPRITPLTLRLQWSKQIEQIISEPLQLPYTTDQLKVKDPIEHMRRSLEYLEAIRKQYGAKGLRIERMFVPAANRILHNEILAHVQKWQKMFTEQIDFLNTGETAKFERMKDLHKNLTSEAEELGLRLLRKRYVDEDFSSLLSPKTTS